MENKTTNEIKNNYTLCPWQIDNIKSHGDCFFEFTLSQRFMAFLKFTGMLLNRTVSEILQSAIACCIDHEALQVWYTVLVDKLVNPSEWFMTFGRIPYNKELNDFWLKDEVEWFMTNVLHRQLILLAESSMDHKEDSFMGIPFSSVDYKKMGIWYKGMRFFEAVLSASFNKFAAQFNLSGEPEHIFVLIPKPKNNVNILIEFPNGSENYLNKKFLVDRQILSLEKEDRTHSFVKIEDFNIAEFSDRFEPIDTMDKSLLKMMREADEWKYRGMTKAQIKDHEVSNRLLSYTSDNFFKRIRIKGADYKKAFLHVFPFGKSAIKPKDEDTVEIFQVSYGPITTKVLN